MPDINELDLVDEGAPQVSFDELPPERGGRLPLPPTGYHTFQIPSNVSKLWEVIQTNLGQRLKVEFTAESPLFVVDTQQPMTQKITTEEFSRGKGDSAKMVNNMAYLLVALGETQAPVNQKGYAEALNRHAGDTFKAEVVYSAKCGNDRDIFKDKAVQPGIKGCGRQYKQEAYPLRVAKDGWAETFKIPQDETGKFASRFECKCGAELSCFANLQNFKSA